MDEISRNNEIEESKSTTLEGYREIKPEGEVSIQEAKDFINNLFIEEKEVSEKCDVAEKDDNNRIYRIGDNLVSNNSYEINGYQYQTDDFGRIVSVEGKLYIKEREERLPIKDSIEIISKGDEREGDDRGHLIGDRFNGSNGMENMIPQDAKINRGDYKKFENELANEIKNGKEVYLKIEPMYEEGSRRPSALVVTYSIDNVESIRIFPNDTQEA
ncbi:DNA/RNA non-specific endonuclease [Anaerotignum lactatifermentans]|uniref:DNA/RNA non-specific endonuclease n=1 Tax=Anaerotignum lactatifermentans TaxID=160404 RepID=UPI001874CE4C|nr:DNA/RNA non-specific endonuclease [Anaerotignum lactatifermentans]MBE5077616.1 DNA/RNA non-specific endonuclease [Anaerotignum lactatifermentans]